MRFPGFLGNDSLKKRLSAAQRGKGLSHCYILSGPQGSGKKTLAKIMAGAMECTGKGESPCGVCDQCHKIFGGGHPDVITVDSDKATVPISVIRQMQADAYIRPNEGKRKVYLIPRAQDMQAPAQNALLKLLEEPPSYCTFILMTDNPEKILPTVRSRSVELTLNPLPDNILRQELMKENCPPESVALAMEQSQGYLGPARELLHQEDSSAGQLLSDLAAGFIAGDELSVILAVLPLEKLKRQELMDLLQQAAELFTRALKGAEVPGTLMSGTVGLLSRSVPKEELYAGIKTLEEAKVLLQANGSPGHCAGYLMANLRQDTL